MSITRNILDPLSNVIGTMTFADGTSESDISAALSVYSTIPVNPTVIKLATTTVSATTTSTTSSSTASVIPSMSVTLTAGKYVILFNGNIYTSGASAQGQFGIYLDGSLVAETKRNISCNLQLLGGLVTVSLNEIGVGTYTGTELVVTEGQTVDIRFKSTNGGTIGFVERVLTVIRTV